jgi:hypothetical protein
MSNREERIKALPELLASGKTQAEIATECKVSERMIRYDKSEADARGLLGLSAGAMVQRADRLASIDAELKDIKTEIEEMPRATPRRIMLRLQQGSTIRHGGVAHTKS